MKSVTLVRAAAVLVSSRSCRRLGRWLRRREDPARRDSSACAACRRQAGCARGLARRRSPGHVTRAALEDYETWKTLRAQDYTPDAAAVKAIAERGTDVQVLAIVATWCPDSKREVPRFFKIYDRAGLGMGTVTMVAVDRSKKDADGLTGEARHPARADVRLLPRRQGNRPRRRAGGYHAGERHRDDCGEVMRAAAQSAIAGDPCSARPV